MKDISHVDFKDLFQDFITLLCYYWLNMTKVPTVTSNTHLWNINTNFK